MKLFTPGPIEMDPETIKIGGIQQEYCRTPEFSIKMLECISGLNIILDAPPTAVPLFITGSGTAAMEAVVMNVFNKTDKVLVIDGGSFGKRFSQLCEIYDIPHESIVLKHDEAFNVNCLNEYANKGFTGMLVNMCETSTGQLYDMERISEFCTKNKICLVVDAISSFLCDPFSMKNMNIDVAIISSQKGLALQPGMAFVYITDEVFSNRVEKNEVKSLYFDFKEYKKDIVRGQTNFTPAIGVINQLHEKLGRILKSGVSSYTDHCARLAKYFREQLVQRTSLVIPNYPLSNCVTPVCTGMYDAEKISNDLRDKYQIYITPNGGELAHDLFRIGHMSNQLTCEDMDMLIDHLIKVCEEIDT